MKAGRPVECLSALVTELRSAFHTETECFLLSWRRQLVYLLSVWEDKHTRRLVSWQKWPFRRRFDQTCALVLLTLTCIIECRKRLNRPSDGVSRVPGEKSLVPQCPAVNEACYLSAGHLTHQYFIHTLFVPD